MKRLKFFLLFLTVIVCMVIVFSLGILIFMKTSPQFGKSPEKSDLERIQKSANYGSGEFINLIETNIDMGLIEGLKLLPEFLFNSQQSAPPSLLPTKFGQGNMNLTDSTVHITWFGHSAFLIEMEGKRILMDPMLGTASSPVPFLTKRFPYEQTIDIEELKDIDAIIISHDHYDHLDFSSISHLKNETDKFYTALGVGSHLREWGVSSNKIIELDWWESFESTGLKFVATPARHFSGRGFSDRNKTQWASWVIIGEKNKIYFSGDSGYGPHFKSIGDKFGPFDFAMMECGQSNEKWASIHMMPEQTVQASLDLKANKMMPIHWGAFDLSLHSWTDPIERVTKSAKQHNQPIVHPMIGLRFDITESPSSRWWETLD